MLLMKTEGNMIFLRVQQTIPKVRGVIRKGGNGVVMLLHLHQMQLQNGGSQTLPR